MIKFFRKYNKQLLAVVVVFLMVVFVGGSAFTLFISPGPGSEVLGSAYGAPVTGTDRRMAAFQASILSRLGLPWNRPWSAGPFGDQSMPALNELDYLLLIREAEAHGAEPDPFKARRILSQMPIDLPQFRLDSRISTANLEQAVANFVMVQELWFTARQSARISELEVMHEVRDQHEQIALSVVALDSSKLVTPEGTIPEQELQAQFEKHKEQAPGSDPLAFGYRIPEQVAIEYIAIQISEIEPTNEVTLKMAEDFYSQNPSQFPQPLEEDVQDEGQTERPPQSGGFEAVKEDVLQFLRQENQIDDARALAEQLIRSLREPWYEEQTTEDAYPARPEGIDAAGYYEGVVQKLQGAVQTQCLRFGKTELFAVEDAATVEPLGGAREDMGSGVASRMFGQLCGRVEGLVPYPGPSAQDRENYLALYQTGPNALIDGDNNLYLYRIVEAQPAKAPDSLADVREQVTNDVRRQRAKQQALAYAEQLKDSIGDQSLEAAWEAFDGIAAEQKADIGAWFAANPFARSNVIYFGGDAFSLDVTVTDQAGNLDNRVDSPEFVAQVFQLAQEQGVNASGTINVDGLEKCFVVQLHGLEPVDTEQYASVSGNVRSGLTGIRVERLKREWFSRDNIRARARFATAI